MYNTNNNEKDCHGDSSAERLEPDSCEAHLGKLKRDPDRSSKIKRSGSGSEGIMNQESAAARSALSHTSAGMI